MKSIVAAAVFLTACSSAPPKDPPALPADDARDRRERARREEDPVLEETPVEPPLPSSDTGAPAGAPPSAWFRGTTGLTNTFGFGGDPYACNWSITLKALVLDVRADSTSGAVQGASFRAQAVEETLPPCEAKPYPPNEHVYEMKKAEVLAPRITRITLVPKATNLPAAAAEIDVDLSEPPGTASIRVHRTDQPPPLDWTVVAKLTLEMK